MTAGRFAAFVASVAAVAGIPANQAFAQAADAATERILVVPFENQPQESRIFWLTEASSVLLTDNLNALGRHAITRDERLEAFERLQVPPAASLTDATVLRIGQIVGATDVVMGSLQLDGDDLTVRARSVALDAGRIERTVTEHGSLADLFDTFDRVARDLAPGTSRPSAQAERPKLAAFEDYIKGLLAVSPQTATAYLSAALRGDEGFDRARLALWDVYTEQDQHDRALAAVQPVKASSPWAGRARFLAGLSQLNLRRYDEAFRSFRALADARPSASIMNDLGVIQLRRGGAGSPSGGSATYFFKNAADADPTDPDYFFNLGYAYWTAHDAQAATYWLREAVRRAPADGDAHFVLGTALAASGSAAEAAREKELARRLSSTYAEWEKRPGGDIPKGLERVKNDVELPHALKIDEVLSGGGQRDQQQMAAFYLDRARRLFQQEDDRDALADLNRVLFFSPYQAEAHLLVGRIHLRAGRVREAIDALKIALWSSETIDGHLALAEAYLDDQNPAAAKEEVEHALALDPSSADARRLLERINGQAVPRGAA